MLVRWLSDRFDKPFGSLRGNLQSHSTRAFRALLFGGNLLLFVGLWILLSADQQHRQYYLWLASFAAILGMLFVFAILSARINGYRRYKDSVLGLATGMMFVLSGVLAVAGLLHP
jgi:hypothetical protein